MAVNKVVYGSQILIDITDSTVNANTLLAGYKAYGANGEQVTGNVTLSYHITLTQAQYDELSETEKMAEENYFYIEDATVVSADINDTTVSPNKVWSSQKVSDELSDISTELSNAEGDISQNTGDITTINTALGNTSISGIGDGSVTGAISTLNNSNSTNEGNITALLSALGNGKVKSGTGSIAGCIENNSMYIIFASRVATNGCGMWLAHRFSGEIYTCEMQNTSNTYTFASNSVGTVAVTFTGGGSVWIGAVRVF